MANNDAQQIWEDYFSRIKSRRIAAAAHLWTEVVAAGAAEDTVFALDFAFFSANRNDAEQLAAQLAKNYSIQVSPHTQPNYLSIEGSTRPDGVCLSEEQHLAWVEFMTDVGQSHACVFSQWTLESSALGRKFESLHLED